MTLSKFFQKWRESIPKDMLEPMLADLTEMMKAPGEGNLFVESTVSHRDVRPLVSVQFGKYAFQIDPNHARKIGGFFIEAAQAAEMDSFLYQFFTSRMDLPRENVGMLIAEFRHWRETHGAINAQPATGPKQ